MRRPLIRTMLALALLAVPSPAAAQWLPDRPLQALDGRLTVSGEVSVTAGEFDDEAFFNYTDYEHNALRNIRAGLSGAWRPFERLAFVGELRTEDLERPRVFAAYVRVRPWPARRFDIQAGWIPPAFGAFGRRAYGTDNPILGYPLAYQYLTSLRADSQPANADDLLRMRGRGWRSSFPIGSQEPNPGVPIISAFRWDTGVMARWGAGPVEIAGSVTNGTLSNPRLDDDNDGKQVSGRVSVTPIVGLVIGASGSTGAWLARELTGDSPERYAQRAAGVDAEYSRDHWLVRGEAVWTRWALPYAAATSNGHDVRAWGAWAEGRYRFTPRVYAAARVDHLGFSKIYSDFDGAWEQWDAPVDRVEGAVGYYLQRNVVARAGLQGNWRDTRRVPRRVFASAQIAWWF
jgi:hypothetical protein